MRTGVPAALLVTLCVLLVAHGSIVPVAGTPAQMSAFDGSATTIEIQLRQNGDARFTIETTVPLQDENDTAAFERVGGEFERDVVGAYPVDAFERAAARASSASNRSMTITNVTRNTTRSGGQGRFVLAFTWRNFGVVNGSHIEIGDAFNTTHGTWLPGLTANQTLVIRPPPGYFLYDSPPISVRANTLRWEGPRSFEPGYLSATYVQGAPPTRSPPNDSVDTFVLVGGAVLFLGVIAVGLFALVGRDLPLVPTGATANEGENEPTDSGGKPPDGPAERTEATDEPDEVDLELLSDEERIERLLKRNGGRMKQATIVTETDWSNAKVSQLLSTMDEDGRIEKLRIGRENLISLPDDEEDS